MAALEKKGVFIILVHFQEGLPKVLKFETHESTANKMCDMKHEVLIQAHPLRGLQIGLVEELHFVHVFLVLGELHIFCQLLMLCHAVLSFFVNSFQVGDIIAECNFFYDVFWWRRHFVIQSALENFLSNIRRE